MSGPHHFARLAVATLALICTSTLIAQPAPPLGEPPIAPASIDAALAAEVAAAFGDAAPLELLEAGVRPDGAVRVVACFADAPAVVRALRWIAKSGGRHAGLRVTAFNPMPRQGAQVPVVTLEGQPGAVAVEASAQAHAIEQIAGATAGMDLPTVRLERIVDSPHGRTITADVMFAATPGAFDAFKRSAAVFARVDRSELVPEMGERHRGMATLTLLVP